MKFAIRVCGLSLILTFGLTLSNPQALGKYLYILHRVFALHTDFWEMFEKFGGRSNDLH